MQNRTPVARSERPALPAFTPVPRQGNRHDGWTPARQVAFIEALADTGCVTRAAAMVNMAQANCYTLRRAPGAEEFRRAWEAALDFGLARLKDIAFERAVEGEFIPVFVAGKLMGYRRKRNDALLMFCLRHYGQDAGGKRTTINYFSTRASAGAGGGAGGAEGGAAAAEVEASTTTVRTVINGDGGDAVQQADALATTMNGFAGVALDDAARAAIEAALAECAARRRALDDAHDRGGMIARDAAEDDPDETFIRSDPAIAFDHRGEFFATRALDEDVDEEEAFAPDEPHWSEIEAAPPPVPAIAARRKKVAEPAKLDGKTTPPDP